MSFYFLISLFQFEPVIDQPDLVHHILLHRCPSFVTQVYDKPCYMGNVGDACYSVVAGWGPGGGVRQRQFFNRHWGDVAMFCSLCVMCIIVDAIAYWMSILTLDLQVYQLPENVGIPVGGENSNTYYRLEIHYNNEKIETGEPHV